MSDEANPPTPEDEAKTQAPKAEGGAPDAPAALAAPDVTDVHAAARPAVPAAQAQKPTFVFLAIVAILSLGLDLGSKAWAKTKLERGMCLSREPITVIQDHFSFIFACNRGGAWGLLQHESEAIRRPFFLGISVLAIAFIVSLYRKLTPQQWALKWGLPLVLGGALGNLVNRIQYNYVVDFIDMYHDGHHWPTFNVADIAIVVGVILMAIDMFTPRKAVILPPAESAAAKPASSTTGDTPVTTTPPAPPAAPEPKET